MRASLLRLEPSAPGAKKLSLPTSSTRYSLALSLEGPLATRHCLLTPLESAFTCCDGLTPLDSAFTQTTRGGGSFCFETPKFYLRLLSRPLSSLKSTLVRPLRSVHSKGLTATLTRLESTLTKNHGEGGHILQAKDFLRPLHPPNTAGERYFLTSPLLTSLFTDHGSRNTGHVCLTCAGDSTLQSGPSSEGILLAVHW